MRASNDEVVGAGYATVTTFPLDMLAVCLKYTCTNHVSRLANVIAALAAALRFHPCRRHLPYYLYR